MLPQIDRTISAVARRLCLTADATGDFRSWAHLELIRDDHRILREFEGRSSLATYLTAVVHNLGRDYRMQYLPRWRPSAAAERLGLTAIQLETLLYRDGFSFDEAAENLRVNHGVKMPRADLADLAGEIPPRVRLRTVGDAGLASASAKNRADQTVEDQERKRTLLRVQKVLAAGLVELDVQDRLILKMHYRSGLAITTIARALDLQPRRLYTRRDRCLVRLRRAFAQAGLDGRDVIEALARLDEDFEVDYRENEAKPDRTGPSNFLNPPTEGPSK